MTVEELDTALKMLNDFRKKFDSNLVMYYPYPRLKQAIKDKEITFFKDENGNIEGYIWIKNLKRKCVSRIEEIYSKRKGLGTEMMMFAKENTIYNDIELKVLDFNERAIRFYKKHGFREVAKETGRKKNNIIMVYSKQPYIYETT